MSDLIGRNFTQAELNAVFGKGKKQQPTSAHSTAIIKKMQQTKKTPIWDRILSTFEGISNVQDGFLFVSKKDLTPTKQKTLDYHIVNNRNLNITHFNDRFYKIEFINK